MFSEHAIRMLRSRWRNPNALAQELFAIFSSAELPLSHSGPVTLTIREGTQAPLTLRQFSDGPVLTFQNTQGQTGSITFDDNGVPQLQAADGTQSGSEEDDDDDEEAGTSVFPCDVVSGSGSTYTVTIYANGRSAAGQNVSANVPSAPTDDIPAGAKWFVFLRGDGTYELDIPVWLE